MRAVLDPNVIISALLSPAGTPAKVLRAWLEGRFELLVSPLLLSELERAFAYPKLRKRISEKEASQVVELLNRSATATTDPDGPATIHSADPGDDYLVALAQANGAALVTGDKHILQLASDLPIFSTAEFLALLKQEGGSDSK